MPDFNGNGPLKRGRVIGRGRGFCTWDTPDTGDARSAVTKKKNVPENGL